MLRSGSQCLILSAMLGLCGCAVRDAKARDEQVVRRDERRRETSVRSGACPRDACPWVQVRGEEAEAAEGAVAGKPMPLPVPWKPAEDSRPCPGGGRALNTGRCIRNNQGGCEWEFT